MAKQILLRQGTENAYPKLNTVNLNSQLNVTVTSGNVTVNSKMARKSGNFIQIYIGCTANAEIQVGSNICTLKISGIPLPEIACSSVGFSGNTAIVSQLPGNGEIIARALSANLIQNFTFGIYLNYICSE